MSAADLYHESLSRDGRGRTYRRSSDKRKCTADPFCEWRGASRSLDEHLLRAHAVGSIITARAHRRIRKLYEGKKA